MRNTFACRGIHSKAMDLGPFWNLKPSDTIFMNSVIQTMLCMIFLKNCWFHCVFYYWPNVTLNFIPRGLELNACSVQNGNTQLNRIFHDLHPPLLLYLREIMKALTYIAFLIINGDEAYAGITGDVLPNPRDINLRASFIKEAQSIARGVAHQLQLLPLAFTNYCGRKSTGHQTCKYHLSF